MYSNWHCPCHTVDTQQVFVPLLISFTFSNPYNLGGLVGLFLQQDSNVDHVGDWEANFNKGSFGLTV